MQLLRVFPVLIIVLKIVKMQKFFGVFTVFIIAVIYSIFPKDVKYNLKIQYTCFLVKCTFFYINKILEHCDSAILRSCARMEYRRYTPDHGPCREFHMCSYVVNQMYMATYGALWMDSALGCFDEYSLPNIQTEKSYQIKPKSGCIYHFPTVLKPNGCPFGSKSIGKW